MFVKIKNCFYSLNYYIACREKHKCIQIKLSSCLPFTVFSITTNSLIEQSVNQRIYTSFIAVGSKDLGGLNPTCVSQLNISAFVNQLNYLFEASQRVL